MVWGVKLLPESLNPPPAVAPELGGGVAFGVKESWARAGIGSKESIAPATTEVMRFICFVRGLSCNACIAICGFSIGTLASLFLF